jgi:ArsR family transcriptional regulator, arsenate/arsenite/antimonite-responsive transcriptional repressor
MADIFDVVADPTRRDLLQLLLDRYVSSASESGDVSVGEIVNTLGLSQPTVSKQLKVLRDAELVTVREVGQHRYYRLNAAPLEELEDWIIPFLSADFDDDDASQTVFAAWSGSELPAPIRKVADSIEHSADAGAAVGRSVADASHQVRTVLGGASATVEKRVIEPLRERLGRKDASPVE